MRSPSTTVLMWGVPALGPTLLSSPPGLGTLDREALPTAGTRLPGPRRPRPPGPSPGARGGGGSQAEAGEQVGAAAPPPRPGSTRAGGRGASRAHGAQREGIAAAAAPPGAPALRDRARGREVGTAAGTSAGARVQSVCSPASGRAETTLLGPFISKRHPHCDTCQCHRHHHLLCLHLSHLWGLLPLPHHQRPR
nr:uncharacterized protein LOC105855120 [Microcebus murinus]